MADASWHELDVVVLSGTAADARAARIPPTAVAVIVHSRDPRGVLIEVAGRTAAPIVIVADVDDATGGALIEAGADDVLPETATLPQAARAARHAVARQRRGGTRRVQPVPDVATASGSGVSQPQVAHPHPRDSAPAGLPPQLQAVGRLAGGVAHDFNNLLQVIGGSAETLVESLGADDSRRPAAQSIVDAARRAATLTQQLLAFGRRQTLIAAPLDLSALINETVGNLRARMGTRVRVVTQLASSLPRVHADRVQLLTVLSTLAENAAEAMGEGGTLTLKTDLVEVDDEWRSGRPWLTEGRYVRMQVLDTGRGIEPHALPHLFEPFFSTKERWGGTGLGLSSAYGIVKQSGGFIWVESQVDEGTAITILLPAVAEAQPVARAPEPKTARVRLVEDDDGVRDLLVGVLQHYGYTVEAFASAEAALADDGPFDLLLSDVLLPGMNGPDLAREVRQRHPGVPVLLMSGDTGHVVDPRELDAGGFLHKPFSARTLATRVEELLRTKKAAT